MKRFLIHFILLFPVFSVAQKQLTLQNIIDITLKNNYDIKIARNYAEIDKMKNTFGYAGGLPVISANAGGNGSVKNISQELTDGASSSIVNAQNTLIDAGIYGSMTLFNGFKIIATKERLNLLQQQSELMLNQQIQNSIASIMLKYYDLIRQQYYLQIIQNTLDVSRKKLMIINERDIVGMAKPPDVLMIQMEVNVAEQSLKFQESLIEQEKADLLQLMGEKLIYPFSLNDSIAVDNSLQFDTIAKYLENNPQFLFAEKQIKIYEQLKKEISAQRYPSVKLNAAYDYSFSTYNYGLTKMNQMFGPSAGLTIQFPIYNGNIYRIQSKSAMINIDNAKLQKEQLFNELKTDMFKTYISYTTALQQIESQKINYELAKKIVEIVLQNFSVNQATILDIKAAQTTFENAAYLLINLQYAAKVAEIELKQMIFKLGPD